MIIRRKIALDQTTLIKVDLVIRLEKCKSAYHIHLNPLNVIFILLYKNLQTQNGKITNTLVRMGCGLHDFQLKSPFILNHPISPFLS